MRRLSDAAVDARNESIREQYPDGLTYEQFKRITLESADDEGRVYPPPLAGMGTFQMILKMSMVEKLLDYRGTHHTPFIPNHFINAAGRAALAQSEEKKL